MESLHPLANFANKINKNKINVDVDDYNVDVDDVSVDHDDEDVHDGK